MIPEDMLIEVGDWFIWDRPKNWEPCKVTAKSDGKDETHIQSVNLKGKLCWNTEDWFREACSVPTEGQREYFEETFRGVKVDG